jgi:proteasome accessory factor A
VSEAPQILALWEDTLLKLRAGELDQLAPRLDWVLKRNILERTLNQHPHLRWSSPELKHLDHLYGSLEDGLYWIYESDFVQRLVSDRDIEHFIHYPPSDTRAWLRSYILRHAGDDVDQVDWDSVRLKLREEGFGQYPSYNYKTIKMEDPLITREDCEGWFTRGESSREAAEC